MVMVDTAKVTERRELRFSTMDDILADVQYLDSGDPPAATGNWTSAQIVMHVAKFIGCSIDGFPVPKASLPVRILGRFIRRRILSGSMGAGLKIPDRFAFLRPRKDVTWEDAVEALRRNIGRLPFERMSARSPVLGRLTHEQWVQFHCRHAEMHFGFMCPE